MGGYNLAEWPYHHAAVINVEGEYRVMDLSIGDEAIPIDQWARSFLLPDIALRHLSEDSYQEVWNFYNTQVWHIPNTTTPEHPAGFTISPAFTLRVDQEPLFEAMRNLPDSTKIGAQSLYNILKWSNPEPRDMGEMPGMVTNYTPQQTSFEVPQ